MKLSRLVLLLLITLTLFLPSCFSTARRPAHRPLPWSSCLRRQLLPVRLPSVAMDRTALANTDAERVRGMEAWRDG